MQEVQKSALEAMTDLLLQQLGELGGGSHGHANLAGRTDRNINDVVCIALHPPPPLRLPIQRKDMRISTMFIESRLNSSIRRR